MKDEHTQEEWEIKFDTTFGDWMFCYTIALRNTLGLSPKELQTLELRKGGETLEKVGKQLGVTRERVRQIEAKAHERIKLQDELKSFIRETLAAREKQVREDMLERVKEIVPDELEKGTPRGNQDESSLGFNQCRVELLEALQKLSEEKGNQVAPLVE